eukprot:356968-Chlamydomonas_euryale.AAC.28
MNVRLGYYFAPRTCSRLLLYASILTFCNGGIFNKPGSELESEFQGADPRGRAGHCHKEIATARGLEPLILIPLRQPGHQGENWAQSCNNPIPG